VKADESRALRHNLAEQPLRRCRAFPRESGLHVMCCFGLV
jgi:hypothetical protein